MEILAPASGWLLSESVTLPAMDCAFKAELHITKANAIPEASRARITVSPFENEPQKGTMIGATGNGRNRKKEPGLREAGLL
jgi:hypothetical protein